MIWVVSGLSVLVAVELVLVILQSRASRRAHEEQLRRIRDGEIF